ncbi:MAG: adenine phosphoribosyltransferase [Chloroflexi bacterium]|nr:adenine phosphoribosyltransferase [Chloroflexota bacterium]
MDLAAYIRSIPDFPQPGVLFRDITTLLKDPCAFQAAIDVLYSKIEDQTIDVVAAIESRGFILGAPLALKLGCSFVPVRKPGKLPAAAIRAEYSLEYGTNALELHVDAIHPGQRVLVVDDLLATGGSAQAAVSLIEQLGGNVIGALFLIELTDLCGADKLQGCPTWSVIRY